MRALAKYTLGIGFEYRSLRPIQLHGADVAVGPIAVVKIRDLQFDKARGDGLTFPLNEFDVSLNTDEPELISVHNFPHEQQRWTLYHLSPKPQFIGALAVEGRPNKIQFFTNYSAR